MKFFKKDWVAEKLFKSTLNNIINNIMCKRNEGLILMGGNKRRQRRRVKQSVILESFIANITPSKAMFMGLFCMH